MLTLASELAYIGTHEAFSQTDHEEVTVRFEEVLDTIERDESPAYVGTNTPPFSRKASVSLVFNAFNNK